MRFSVITPSFRNSNWLKLCVASVADQGVTCEHIIQDAGSNDGTLDWLPHDPRVKAFVEKDSGMYDAVNRGLCRATGDILSYLNCDEQYLPGTLAAVEKFFSEHPDVEMVFADFVVVDAEGNYRFHRKVQKPRLYHTWVCHLPAFTCATFFRRSVISERGIAFDARLRVVGDAEWMLRVLRSRVRMAVLRRFTSTFTLTGGNLGTTPEGLREAAMLFNTAPLWARKLRPLLALKHRLHRLAGGIYFHKPFSYSIYTLQNPAQRTLRHVDRPTGIWHQKQQQDSRG